jgi:photosystem II stability/assembly factor-like uncharacterized protein
LPSTFVIADDNGGREEFSSGLRRNTTMPKLYVATNGLSVWSSDDLGDTIGRMPSTTGLYSGSQVWSLAPHPTQSHILLAGTDSGVYRLDQTREQWTHLPSPMDDRLVTALAFDPAHPDTIVAGTQPAAFYRTDDAGRTWTTLDVTVKPYVTSGFYAGDKAADASANGSAQTVKHWTRVTQIVFHPEDPSVVLAGVEIDGAWRSTDGGRTWARADDGLVTDDIHGFGFVHDESAGARLFATTNKGLHVSRDAGATWTLESIDSPWQYTRTIMQRADRSDVVFLTNGNGPPGTNGKLFRSRDHGARWNNVDLPVEPESSMYFMATNPADPQLVFAATNLGQVFRSRNGGEEWTVLPRRLPEVRAMAWLAD